MAQSPMPDSPMSGGLEQLCSALDLRRVGDGRFSGDSVRLEGLRGAFGGQLLAQMIIAADRTVPAKTVKSLHAIFVRPVAFDTPTLFEVEVMHGGRLYSSATVNVVQEAGLCVRSLVLLDTADVELASHSSPPPQADPPEQSQARSLWDAADIRVVGDVDLDDPDATGPAELLVWARFPGAPEDDGLNRGLLAFTSEPYVFAAALRPHRGLGQRLVGTRIAPAVITHSITFHGPVSAGDWHLFHFTSPHLGRGRIFGQASVFTEAGELVASVSQENQLRPIRPAEAAPAVQ